MQQPDELTARQQHLFEYLRRRLDLSAAITSNSASRSKPIVGRFFAEFDNQQQADVAESDDSHADGFHSGHACFLTR